MFMAFLNIQSLDYIGPKIIDLMSEIRYILVDSSL